MMCVPAPNTDQRGKHAAARGPVSRTASLAIISRQWAVGCSSSKNERHLFKHGSLDPSSLPPPCILIWRLQSLRPLSSLASSVDKIPQVKSGKPGAADIWNLSTDTNHELSFSSPAFTPRSRAALRLELLAWVCTHTDHKSSSGSGTRFYSIIFTLQIEKRLFSLNVKLHERAIGPDAPFLEIDRRHNATCPVSNTKPGKSSGIELDNFSQYSAPHKRRVFT